MGTEVHFVSNGADPVFDDCLPVALISVGKPGGGADAGTVIVCTNAPLESAVAEPTSVVWTRITTLSAGSKHDPNTVT